MLGLTPKEIKELESLDNPTVYKVLELLKTINSDPTLVIYTTMATFTEKVCKEIATISGDVITRSTKDDKTFERINAFVKEMQGYLSLFKQAREILKTENLLESDGNIDSKKGKTLQELAAENKKDV